MDIIQFLMTASKQPKFMKPTSIFYPFHLHKLSLLDGKDDTFSMIHQLVCIFHIFTLHYEGEWQF